MTEKINRIFVTADPHRDFRKIKAFLDNTPTTYEDVLLILGDAGINYTSTGADYDLKSKLSELPITFFLIQGNHEERPQKIRSYKQSKWGGGVVYIEEEFPNLIFAKDGENYKLKDKEFFIIGGAWLSGINARYCGGFTWFSDMDVSPETKLIVEDRLSKMNWECDYVLTHTCPFKFQPNESFTKGVDQGLFDKSTEHWLDTIEEKLDYNMWLFGHYHINKDINEKVKAVYNQIIELK